MRHPNIDKVEIVEPPIEELSKNRSSFRRTCFTGCGCIIVFIIAIIIAIWFAIGPSPKTIKILPGNFPGDIPLYDKDNIEQMTYISGKYKSRGLAVAAFFPKIILSPLLLRANQSYPGAPDLELSPATSRTDYLRRVWHLLTTPVSDKRDSVQIEWHNLDAEPNFIVSYYKKELRKAGFTINEDSQNHKQISFSKNMVDGTFSVVGDEEQKPGTDYALLTVNLK